MLRYKISEVTKADNNITHKNGVVFLKLMADLFFNRQKG